MASFMYPVSKGDQLCPLGFHPQVRWPTRCKRCFRDYKEHGGRRTEDVAASTPSLTDASRSRIRDTTNSLDRPIGRSWTSTSNLSSANNNEEVNRPLPKRPSSWTSTPDLEEASAKSSNADVIVNLALPPPRRRHTTMLDIAQAEETITLRRPPLPPSSKEAPEDLVILRTDSLAERARKMQLKKQNSLEREGSRERSLPRSIEKEKSPLPDAQVKKKIERRDKEDAITKSKDVQFLIQIKDTHNKHRKRTDDSSSITTDTTDTTLIDTSNDLDLKDQIESLKRDLELTKSRAERAERDKSDILLKRLASMDTVSNRTAATEALKLQQKVNDLNQQLEDLKDDKKFLSVKVKELEKDIHVRSEDDLKKKLQAAEQLCEELMDENEDMKKELRNMEQEIDEMQDNFRDDQEDKYASVKKELEQTTKNCRILSFKFKKSERKIEQLESEKIALSTNANSELLNKIKKLEDEIRISNEVTRQLKAEIESNQKTGGKSKAPSLGTIGKSTSADGKFSRASLTRGGSQEDPVQLLRDLQDSMERETDIREQLKFAEEEAESLRKKASRVEDENESLMMQLKKMATKARSRKLSPTAPSRQTLQTPLEKDEGLFDEEDPAELRVLLELNEQESSQLRRKVEELENNNETSKKQIKELQEKLKLSAKQDTTPKGKLPTFMSKTLAGDKDTEKKFKEFEKNIIDLKRDILDKEKTIEKLQKNSKELPTSDVNFKGQLESVEQEATVLRTKLANLEKENEKILTENKKLALHSARLARKDSTTSEKDKLELTKTKDDLARMEREKDELSVKLKNILEIPADKLPPFVPKKYSDTNTKYQLQKIIGELEDEVKEMRAVIVRTGGNNLKKLEEDKQTALTDLLNVKGQLTTANAEIKSLKIKKDNFSSNAIKVTELEEKFKKSEQESDKLQTKIRNLEDKITKQDQTIKQSEAAKTLLENQMKFDQEKYVKLEKEFDKEKKERIRWEAKVTELDGDILTNKKNFEKTKTTLDKEIAQLKTKVIAAEGIPSKKIQELRKQSDELQAELDRDKKRYSELTGKYEQLEEEHVLTKAQLTTEKENIQHDLAALRTKLSDLETENGKIKKEKQESSKKLSEAQLKIKDLQHSSVRNGTAEYENNRLKSKLAEKDQEYEKLKQENEMNQDVGMQLKREIDELRRKLSDFERVSKVQNTLNDHSSNLEQEVRKLTQKVETTEIAAKSEVAATRLRYEQQIKNLHTELSSIQRQCERFKRDRDASKQLLEAATKTIGDLKHNSSSSGRVSRASLNSGDEDDKSKILTLEQQIGCLEDELCEARLETSKTKTELVSEKSVLEIKISEMQSRLNEYEEDRLMNSGRVKNVGIRPKLELSWQKEREDQQRILQETSTLARDLRQTLFEVERERDKERLESRRKLDLLKKANEEELDEGRKKVSELQCDLLELRDAHAKLRTSNEKLRRERDRFEKDRESAARRRLEQDGERKVGALLQTVDELVKIAPDLVPHSNSNNQPRPNNTQQRHNRSPSPNTNTIQISNILARLGEASEELRKYQRVCEDEREKDRMQNRKGGMRRAASTENDTPEMSRHTMRVSRSSPHNGSLYRKSLSLDQSMQHPDQTIWKNDDDSMSSMQSIDSEFGGGMVRDSSMDSRLSGGSTQSDMPRGPRKKKRGLMGKLRSLTKGREVESEGSVQGSDSDVSISSDFKSSKSNFKGRLSDMFKRAGSSSRDSTERLSSSSTQRPVSVTTVNLSNGQRDQLPPPPLTPRVRRAGSRPPTPSGSTPSLSRKAAK